MGSGVGLSSGLLQKSRCPSRGVLGISVTPVSTNSCLAPWGSHMNLLQGPGHPRCPKFTCWGI